ncbi:hypothetical protein BJ322DRAFT_1018422 [Thelephora terrestris]|uniref:Uncharacterized protein n=1 Tax=Thelephora terrestris TaxID=56493 RepID=A0A9P6HLZ7_9AGAM|nr:hypothetical protein BJ322DRAFT_1018422 [Thelephora terrestris]
MPRARLMVQNLTMRNLLVGVTPRTRLLLCPSRFPLNMCIAILKASSKWVDELATFKNANGQTEGPKFHTTMRHSELREASPHFRENRTVKPPPCRRLLRESENVLSNDCEIYHETGVTSELQVGYSLDPVMPKCSNTFRYGPEAPKALGNGEILVLVPSAPAFEAASRAMETSLPQLRIMKSSSSSGEDGRGCPRLERNVQVSLMLGIARE